METKSISGGFIELGRISDDSYNDEPISVGIDEGSTDKHKYYPCLYITSENEIDLGDSGEATISYSRKQIGQRKKSDGSVEYTYELDVKGIKPTGSTSTKDSSVSGYPPNESSGKGFMIALMKGSKSGE